MFDLIGYWGAVTFFTSMILVWVLPLCILVLDYLIIMITKGDYKWVLYEKTYKRLLDNFCNYHLFCVLSIIIIAVSNILIFILYYEFEMSFLTLINKISLKLTPVFSYLSTTALSWFAFLFLGRFIYSLSKDIATLKSKAAKEENNE